VQSGVVVETDDVIGDVSFGLGLIGISALPDLLHFEVQEEAFGHGVDASMSKNLCFN
jgi:hypothetical protein